MFFDIISDPTMTEGPSTWSQPIMPDRDSIPSDDDSDDLGRIIGYSASKKEIEVLKRS